MDRRTRGTSEFYQASFTFEDHGVVELLTTLIEAHGLCMDHIMHFSSSTYAQ
jgi:hypothetical protein